MDHLYIRPDSEVDHLVNQQDSKVDHLVIQPDGKVDHLVNQQGVQVGHVNASKQHNKNGRKRKRDTQVRVTHTSASCC